MSWEPYDDYEAYTRKQDEAYERFIAGKTHETCVYCDQCGTDLYVCDHPKLLGYIDKDELVQGVCEYYTEDLI